MRGANRTYFGGLINLSLVVPILYAELQVLARGADGSAARFLQARV
jgi:hypothetical protein